jgi:hypothetical protein
MYVLREYEDIMFDLDDYIEHNINTRMSLI